MASLSSVIAGIVTTTFAGGVLVSLLKTRSARRESVEREQEIASQPPPPVTAEPTLSRFSSEIYQLLRARITGDDPRLAYADLVAQLIALSPKYLKLTPADPGLLTALENITRACRKKRLPALTAIVVRKSDGLPGSEYFSAAHRRVARDPSKREAAWQTELEEVRATVYPPVL
jgi:hypothetical protein